MTYNVFSATLNSTHFTSLLICNGIIKLHSKLTCNPTGVMIRHQCITGIAFTLVRVFNVDTQLTADSHLFALVFVYRKHSATHGINMCRITYTQRILHTA